MTETVCVTLEQLRDIEKAGVGSWQYEQSGCPACAAELPDLDVYARDENGNYQFSDDGELIELEEPFQPLMKHVPNCWLAKALARAERLKDWKPKVGDRVRLKAMPRAGTYKVIETLGRMCRIGVTSESKVTFGIDGQWRERAELMPEEGE